MKLFVLIKRKGSKNFTGVIPAKKSTTKSALRKNLSGRLKKGLSFKIVNETELNSVLKKLKPKGKSLRRVRNNSIKRKR